MKHKAQQSSLAWLRVRVDRLFNNADGIEVNNSSRIQLLKLRQPRLQRKPHIQFRQIALAEERVSFEPSKEPGR